MIARRRVAVLLLGLAPVLSGCDSSASKSSGEPEAIPETPEAYRERSAQLRREGKPKEAVDAALRAYTLARSGPRVLERIELAKSNAASVSVAKNEAERGRYINGAINEIKSLEKEKSQSGLAVDEVNIAEVYALIGDPNAVFRWLERAVTAKSPNLASVETNPDFEPVKSDPRWAQFVASIKS